MTRKQVLQTDQTVHPLSIIWPRLGTATKRRAVDHEGEVLESFASKTRDKAAALTFMKKLMKRRGRAKAITTDGLRSYKAAMKDLGNTAGQEIGR